MKRMRSFRSYCFAGLVLLLPLASVALAQTYAERLGWDPGARVVILHVDDAGMSHDSNVGALRATTAGLANSMSVMMPCPWVRRVLERESLVLTTWRELGERRRAAD